MLKVSIHDNGLGAQEITKGIGLTGMEERMAELGGKIKAGNAPEGGFTLDLSIPLEHYGSTYRALGKRELLSESESMAGDRMKPTSEVQLLPRGSSKINPIEVSKKVELYDQ